MKALIRGIEIEDNLEELNTLIVRNDFCGWVIHEPIPGPIGFAISRPNLDGTFQTIFFDTSSQMDNYLKSGN